MKRGDQIAYIPTHAEGDVAHPDVEFGFVTGVGKLCVFCRYWSKFSPGELRTKAGSESTPMANLLLYTSQPQKFVDDLLEKL